MNRSIRIASAWILALAVGLIHTASVEGTSIVKMNLSEMVNRSGRIIVGTCIAIEEKTVQSQNGGEISYTNYTFSVAKSIKGDAGATMEVRQFLYPSANSSGRVHTKIVGMPTYELNHEYLLILTAESKLGLSAPVGLPQGYFKVSNAKTGGKEVVNGMNNAGLFHKFPSDGRLFKQTLNPSEARVLAQKQGPIQYDAFVGILEKLVK
jgi:hypothetical protein